MGDKKDWKTDIKREIKKLEEWKYTDRLSMAASLIYANGSLASTVSGWNVWLTNPLIIERFNEGHMKALVEKFNTLAIAFLYLDLEYTGIMEECEKKEMEEYSKNTVKENQKKVKPYAV